MHQITIQIEGMHCSMCASHISATLRQAFPDTRVTTSHARRQSVILSQTDIPEETLHAVLDPTGYTIVSIEHKPYQPKKPRFSFFR